MKSLTITEARYILLARKKVERASLEIKALKVKLRTRNDVDYTLRFQHIAKEFAKWKHDAILDGEITVLNENGVSHFNSLEIIIKFSPFI